MQVVTKALFGLKIRVSLVQGNWGVGLYYDAISPDLKDSLAPTLKIGDAHGMEIFYNSVVAPWLVLGADLQIIKPSPADDTAVFSGLRTAIEL